MFCTGYRNVVLQVSEEAIRATRHRRDARLEAQYTAAGFHCSWLMSTRAGVGDATIRCRSWRRRPGEGGTRPATGTCWCSRPRAADVTLAAWSSRVDANKLGSASTAALAFHHTLRSSDYRSHMYSDDVSKHFNEIVKNVDSVASKRL